MPSTPGPAGASGVHARRVIFIDLARALAVMLMLYGHTVSALLAPQFKVGRWFDVWQFQRGLTSSLFLLLSGFAFSIATSRHWPAHVRLSPAVSRRLRRFVFFVALGYALHFPAARVVDVPRAAPASWQAFLAVDVLQLIGSTFVGVQLLVMATRSRRVFTATAFALAVACAAATPWIWSHDWRPALPPAIAAYVSPATGSQFPLFPWSAFVLLGAGLGQLYGRWGAANLRGYSNLALALPGAAMTAVGLIGQASPYALFGSGPGNFVPMQFLVRAGACLIGLAAIAHASRRIERLPHVFGAVAQESLVIYFVHLCLVYGSVWNKGLAQMYGMTLGPAATIGFVIVLIALMVVLAWQWNRLKHAQPRAARWFSVAVGAVLLARLL